MNSWRSLDCHCHLISARLTARTPHRQHVATKPGRWLSQLLRRSAGSCPRRTTRPTRRLASRRQHQNLMESTPPTSSARWLRSSWWQWCAARTSPILVGSNVSGRPYSHGVAVRSAVCVSRCCGSSATLTKTWRKTRCRPASCRYAHCTNRTIIYSDTHRYRMPKATLLGTGAISRHSTNCGDNADEESDAR